MSDSSAPSDNQDPIQQLLHELGASSPSDDNVDPKTPLLDEPSSPSGTTQSELLHVAALTRSHKKKPPKQPEEQRGQDWNLDNLSQDQLQELAEQQLALQEQTQFDDDLLPAGAEGGELPGHLTLTDRHQLVHTPTAPPLPPTSTSTSAPTSSATPLGTIPKTRHPDPPARSSRSLATPPTLRPLPSAPRLPPSAPALLNPAAYVRQPANTSHKGRDHRTPAPAPLLPEHFHQHPSFGMPPTAQPEDHRLKPLLKPFLGTESASATLTWVYQLESQARLRHWTDETTVIYAAERFQAAAATWYEARLRDTTGSAYQWATLKPLFLNRFCPTLTTTQEEGLRKQLVHAENEPLVEFLDKCVQAADAIFISRGVDPSNQDYFSRRNQLIQELFLQKAHQKYRKELCIQLRQKGMTFEMLQDEAQTLQAALDFCDGDTPNDFTISAAAVSTSHNQQKTANQPDRMSTPEQVNRARRAQRQRMILCRRCNQPNHYSFYCTANESELSYLARRRRSQPTFTSPNKPVYQPSGPRNFPTNRSNNYNSRPNAFSQQNGFRRRNVNAVHQPEIQPATQDNNAEDSHQRTVSTIVNQPNPHKVHEYPFMVPLDSKLL